MTENIIYLSATTYITLLINNKFYTQDNKKIYINVLIPTILQ